MGVTPKSFAEGSSFPDHSDPSVLRVYSMRFCPFAQRTRLLVNHLNIPHEEVNINLKSKPDWFLARNPMGLVPVLEQGNKVVYESAICNEYLNDTHGNKFLPADPYKKARTKILMELYSKVTEKFYGIILSKKTPEEKAELAEELRKQLKKYDDALATGTYFGGDEPNLLDFHIWPWFERFFLLEKVGGVAPILDNSLPHLKTWVKNMETLPAVKATALSPELHYEFVQQHMSGSIPNYDAGL